MESVVHTWVYQTLLGAVCGVVGFRFGWRSGQRFALPLIQGGLGFVAFAGLWRIGGLVPATLGVAGWVVGTSLVAIPSFARDPSRTDRQVLRARTYREEMFDWLRTGRGPESRPLATAWRHLRELVVYVAAAVVSANLLGLVMGAVLLNYMNAYVARLLQAAVRPLTVGLLAWNVWSVVRVAAYVALGSACAAPLAGRLGYPAHPGQVRLLLIAGGIGAVADLLLKLALSRPCGRLLGAALAPSELSGTGAGSSD